MEVASLQLGALDWPVQLCALSEAIANGVANNRRLKKGLFLYLKYLAIQIVLL